ncbi:MAG TPA: hypothetical protein VJA21_02225 [Verrucomicrobiae bacterium]
MKSGYWENLRPFEKRVVVAVAALFFVVLNFLFVFPYFSEWSKVDDRMFQARRKLRMYSEEVSKTNTYWIKVREMEKAGLEVPPEDQVRHFANTIDSQAGKSGVNMTSGGRTTTSTNQFFIELSRSIGALSPEQPLVDFLYNLGSGNSLIRVRDLNLRPDPARQQIVATVTLVASYQKKVAAKPPVAGPASRSLGSQPATPTKK